jgi:hypothetical protein
MHTKPSSYPIDEAVPPPVASGLKAEQSPGRWRKHSQVVGKVRVGQIASDDEFYTLKELVARLEAENAGLRRQIRIYRELCVVD